jgi:hypothetical protein
VSAKYVLAEYPHWSGSLLDDVTYVLREGYADTMGAATIIEIIELNAKEEAGL